ncbi:hypothetical protein NIES4074_45890 [Cylindrospermum sp. NIES-4074]|nr:hypothetical protein NIES4074_45890 [Cylindrospermum sp. NIES-4074]
MVNNKFVSAVVVAWVVVACAMPTTAPVKTPAPKATYLTCNFSEEQMTSNEITIKESTQPTISGHLVGVSNIWERELPDDQGAIASGGRFAIAPRMSASLSIQDIASEQTRAEKVFAGSVLSLGADRYCVVNVEEGNSTPGMITLRKIMAVNK